MTFRVVPPVLGLAFLPGVFGVWAAAAGEHWEAVSTTAMAITGDVTVSPDRITFANDKSFPLAPAGTVPQFGAPTDQVSATLYKVTAPDDPLLLHGNRLCGGRAPQPVTFIAIRKPALVGSDIDPRSLAAFSGSVRPTVAGRPGLLRNV
jgi:hypothetical protein